MADRNPSLTHRQIEQLLAVYRDLSEQEKTAVTQHLATCPDCARLAEENRQFDGLLKRTAWKQPAPRLSENFYQVIEADGRSWFQLVSHLSGQLAGIAVLGLVV
ncbi:MAG: zf-HC2 domain-containing protein, partial [Candidatus Promineifilaceae bacterium]